MASWLEFGFRVVLRYTCIPKPYKIAGDDPKPYTLNPKLYKIAGDDPLT